MLSKTDLVQRLPDLPRWVEVRDLLRWEGSEVFALQSKPELAFVLRDPETASVFVVGHPAVSAVQAAVQPNIPGANVVASQENGSWLARALLAWTRTRIIVHTLAHPGQLPAVPLGQVAFVDVTSLDPHIIPADLLEELKSGAENSPLAAALVDGQPVAFCYAGSQTETLWDVAIDTLPAYRRQGHAARCAAHLIRHFQAQGKQPVWQSVEENPASWRLAQKLGFQAVDELAFFEVAP
jgi:ribosomal protein S18 acetylase RimI-like enzyme